MVATWISRVGHLLKPSPSRTPAAAHLIPPRSKEETENAEKEIDKRLRSMSLGGPELMVEDEDTVLTLGERWWRDLSPVLLAAGYQLRPRYQPDWRPSWQGTDRVWDDCEDRVIPSFFRSRVIMDAVRIADGLPVTLKRVNYATNLFEFNNTIGLAEKSAANDPHNHCMRIHDVVPIPDDPMTIILVLPHLRAWDSPSFETIGEAIDFFDQVFEGLAFMHRRGMAHRDVHHLNIMMEARSMYPDGWHPIETDKGLGSKFTSRARHFTRTQRPPRYILIDFGISGFYDRRHPTQDVVIRGGDRSCPEQQGNSTHADPFPSDVYFIGNTIKEYFVENKKGFGFMEALINDMTHPDPLRRPTMDEVVRQFRVIRGTLAQRTLRARVVPIARLEWSGEKPVRFFTYWWHRVGYALRHTPAVPRPC